MFLWFSKSLLKWNHMLFALYSSRLVKYSFYVTEGHCTLGNKSLLLTVLCLNVINSSVVINRITLS
jgi:hypothetical protein